MKNFFAFLVLLTLFAIYVWPTRYQHFEPGDRIKVGIEELDVYTPVRVDRITGAVETQGADGAWREAGSTQRAVAFERPAIDPAATNTPSLEENERVVSQGQHAIESTQDAVDKQIRK
ncbi:MAG TPA: hypothetical protein VKP65_06985 [Rhodothermales bacterium]|nr:hypothetical protein [Rhodothermales bacterium]